MKKKLIYHFSFLCIIVFFINCFVIAKEPNSEPLELIGQSSHDADQIIISLDSAFIITGGDMHNNEIKIWNTSGRVIKNLTGHKSKIDVLSISNDGKTFLSAGDDQYLIKWDITRGKQLKKIHLKNPLFFIKQTPDLIIGQEYNVIKIWDNNLKLIRSFSIEPPHNGIINISPDGSRIYIACLEQGKNGTIKIYNNTGELLSTFSVHPDIIQNIQISSDGNYVITNTDKEIKIWDRSGKFIREIDTSSIFKETSINKLIISPNSKYLIIDTSIKALGYVFKHCNRVYIFTFDGKLIKSVDNIDRIKNLVFSPNNKFFTYTTYGDHFIYDFSRGSQRKINESSCVGIENISISPDGKYILSNYTDGKLQLIDISGKQMVNIYNAKKSKGKAVWDKSSLGFYVNNSMGKSIFIR